MSFLVSLLGSVGTWIFETLFKDLILYVQSLFVAAKKQQDDSASEASAAADYQKVVDNPNATRQEREDAENKLLNK